MIDVSGSPLRDKMIFLVGSRRSGTNWLQRIIGMHPDVATVPSESELFSLGLAPLTERFHHGAIGSYRLASTYIERDELIGALRRFCDTAFEAVRRSVAPSASRIFERTPDHALQLELMNEIYPDAYYIHIIRDGRDVARSLAKQAYGPNTIGGAAAQWKRTIEIARAAAPKIARYREVRYEQLIADPRAGAIELFDWLGLEHSPELLENVLHEAQRPYNVDPSDQRIGTDKWKARFSPEDIAAFDAAAGDLLDELGYERDATAAAPAVRPSQTSESVTLSEYARRKASSLRTRVVRSLIGTDAPEGMDEAQATFDRLANDIAAKRFSSIGGLFRSVARIQIVDSSGEWTGTGPEAIERLQSTLENDEALNGRQVRGDTWPALSGYFAMFTYRSPDGALHDRAMVMYFNHGEIMRFTYYKLPLGSSLRD